MSQLPDCLSHFSILIMDLKNNSCKILFNREIEKKSDSCDRIISDLLNRKTEIFYRKDLVAHYGCVNAVEFSNNGQFLVSGVFFWENFYDFFLIYIIHLIIKSCIFLV